MATETSFYYDELMNEDRTTFSVYLYKGQNTAITTEEDGNNVKDNSAFKRTSRNYKDQDSKEILRGIINQNINMGTQVVWNGSPLNLSSAWANLATNLKSTTRNLRNSSLNLTNTSENIFSSGTGENSGRLLVWNQDAYYSVSEFQKTFGGMTMSTPLTFSMVLLPYIDINKGYQSVRDQIEYFLDCIYPNEEYSNGQDYQAAANASSNSSTDSNGNEKKWYRKALEWITNAGAGILNWAANALDTIGDSLFDEGKDKYMITIKPPHGYLGVPLDFIEGQWMSNTLAIRFGTRQIYNLLISTININLSKEVTYYNGKYSPSQAQLDLSFQPVLVMKPSEIKSYLLDNQDE